MNLKNLVKGNVYFVEYHSGNLWYEAGRHSAEKPFLFPVPVKDIDYREVLLACDLAITYERHIRKHLDVCFKQMMSKEPISYGETRDYY